MQLSVLYSEIGQALNDPNHDRWPTSVLLPRINEATTDILVYTNAVKTREDLTSVVGTEGYALDANTIDVIRIDVQNTDGDWVKLQGMLRDQLDFQDPNWQQRDNGKPLIYWWDGTNQTIHLVPKPDSSWAVASGIRVWEIQKPTDLSATTDVPFDSNNAMIPYHRAIVHYVAGICWMDDGTPEGLQKSRFHKSNNLQKPGEYEREIMKILRKFDAPEDIPASILWKPQGGRASTRGVVTKENLFGQ